MSQKSYRWDSQSGFSSTGYILVDLKAPIRNLKSWFWYKWGYVALFEGPIYYFHLYILKFYLKKKVK